jgi:hypothetical protein
MSIEPLNDSRSITLTGDNLELVQWAVADAIAQLLVKVDNCNVSLDSRPLLRKRYNRLVDAGRAVGMNL